MKKDRCGVSGCKRVAWYPDQHLYDEPTPIECDECGCLLCKKHVLEMQNEVTGVVVCEDCYAGKIWISS